MACTGSSSGAGGVVAVIGALRFVEACDKRVDVTVEAALIFRVQQLLRGSTQLGQLRQDGRCSRTSHFKWSGLESLRRNDVIDALKEFEGSREALATIYLTGPGERLLGSVPLVKIAISPPGTRLSELSEPAVSCAPDTPEDEVAELFDKYNLITLAVVDEHDRLAGIITADDVITMLRHSHCTRP